MEITWYGHSCFRITERNMATVVTDPYENKALGYKPLALKGDIITISQNEPEYNYVDAIKGSEWQITGPGEYEIGGVFLTAVPTEKDKKSRYGNMVYTYDYDGVNVVHLGRMKNVPTRAEIELIGNADVLLIPVGGGDSMNAAKAAEVISMLEPGIVVPMRYKTNNSKLELNEINQFLKEMGLGQDVETQNSLKLTRSKIPDETHVELLSDQHKN